MAFTNEQLERYSRHIILKEIGVKGQKKLLNAKVLIIGAGGLGAPVAMYLAAAVPRTATSSMASPGRFRRRKRWKALRTSTRLLTSTSPMRSSSIA